jgi:hypothetical protein
MRYGDDLTLRDARQQYFERSGFGDGGYGSRWVKLQVGPIPVYFPNTKARVRAVKLHDLHHVLTEYDTTWSGEAEIGAWEVASGCGGHYAAWLLNLNAFALGLVIAPGAVYRAFMRGRSTSNLYAGQFDESLLTKIVGTTRRELRLDGPVGLPSVVDRAAFMVWAVTAVLCLVAPPASAAAVLVLGVLWLRG